MNKNKRIVASNLKEKSGEKALTPSKINIFGPSQAINAISTDIENFLKNSRYELEKGIFNSLTNLSKKINAPLSEGKMSKIKLSPKYAKIVQQAKENGFSLKEIAAIMKSLTKSKSCTALLKMIDKRLADIQQEKKYLIKSEKFLKKLSSSCPAKSIGKNCKEIEQF